MENAYTLDGVKNLKEKVLTDELIDRDILENRKSAYLLALQLLRNPEDAMDISQEAVLKFYSSLSRFNRTCSVRPWLMKITRNLAIDFMRRRKTRGYEKPAEKIDCAGCETASPEYILAKDERQKIVWLALSALNDKYREIIIFRDYNDLSYREISEVLDIPIGTVMSRLHKARMILREKLTKKLFGGTTP